MFVVGAAVTLAIVLVVIFVIQIYKRRRHASKLSSSVLAVDTIEMQNETAPEASQNNQVSVSKAFFHNWWLAQKEKQDCSRVYTGLLCSRSSKGHPFRYMFNYPIYNYLSLERF